MNMQPNSPGKSTLALLLWLLLPLAATASADRPEQKTLEQLTIAVEPKVWSRTERVPSLGGRSLKGG
jgi:hypothetical protein